jgi:low temperature requirement protein LtrA
VGASAHRLDVGVVTGVLLGLAAACAMWWLYFDVVVRAAERRLARAEGEERIRIARDSFLPALAALGMQISSSVTRPRMTARRLRHRHGRADP